MKISRIGIVAIAIAIALPGIGLGKKIDTATVITPYNVSEYDSKIIAFYRQAGRAKTMGERIERASAYFKGAPYFDGALGEGPTGEFDKSPLYRTDKFDCLTYVSTVLALAKSDNLREFKQNILRIRYQNGEVSYNTRNHFTSLNWNPENLKNGFIKEYTPKIVDERGRPLMRTATTVINKPAWLQQAKPHRIKQFEKLSQAQTVALIQKLRKLGEVENVAASSVHYLPITALYDDKGQPKEALFKQIPHGAIIEIVRPNWNLTQFIGTHLNISHLGFGIWTEEGLMYREASSSKRNGTGVIDIRLADYLKHYITSETVKGIAVFKVV